jgi:probable F420-dependent oxidoreductase
LSSAVVLPFWLDRPVLEALEIAANADALGFDELWVGEMATFDAFALGGAIARETRRVSLWIGPLAIGLRDPAALALGIASVSALGGRPAHLALGASTPAVVTRWHGRPWRRTVAHMRECVAALRQILAGERSNFEGAHVASTGFRLPGGPSPSNLAVAAFGERMIAAAATLGDRVVVNLLTPAQIARVRRTADAAAAAAASAPPPIVAWVPAALDPGPATLSQLARQLVSYLAAPGYGEMFTDAGFGDLVLRARGGAHPRDLMNAIPEEMVAAVAALGSPSSVRTRLDEFRAAGANVVAVVPATAEDPGARKLLLAVA